MNRFGLLAVFAVVVLVACGGGGGTDGGSGGGAGGGSGGGSGGGTAGAGNTVITLTGARTQTLDGGATNTQWLPMSNLGEVSLTVTTSTEQAAYDFQFQGEPAVRTYVGDTDAGITCNVYDTLTGGLDGWMADRGTGIGDPGDCSVTLTSVSLKQDVGTKRTYDAHGSVTAHLPARSGSATGTINFSASF